MSTLSCRILWHGINKSHQPYQWTVYHNFVFWHHLQPAIKVNIIWFHLTEKWALLPPTCFFCSMENKINLSHIQRQTTQNLTKIPTQNRHSWKKIQFSKPFLVSMPSNCWRFDPRWINLRWLCIRMHFTVDGRNPAPIAMASIPVFTGFCIQYLNWQLVQDLFQQQYWSD